MGKPPRELGAREDSVSVLESRINILSTGKYNVREHQGLILDLCHECIAQ